MAFDLLGCRLPDVDDRQPVTVVGLDLLAGHGVRLGHGRPPSIPPLEDRRGSAGSGGRGEPSPCAVVRPADPTRSPEPAKPSPSWRRSSHRATASKAVWPTLGSGLNRFGSSAVPAMDLRGVSQGLENRLPGRATATGGGRSAGPAAWGSGHRRHSSPRPARCRPVRRRRPGGRAGNDDQDPRRQASATGRMLHHQPRLPARRRPPGRLSPASPTANPAGKQSGKAGSSS